ncbi:MAG: APC family permease [Candidatus Micrarchaeales archaeon]
MSMRKIGIASATAVGLGAIIGAGIFVLSGTAIALAGSFALPAFLIVGAVAMIVALVFGELGSIFPYAKGASYSYAYNAFGSEIGFITGILQYISYATAASAISLGFGSYLSGLLGISSELNSRLLALLLIVAIAIVNALGIRKAAKVDLVLVIIKVVILFIFIAFVLIFISGSKITNNINFSTGFGAESFFSAVVAIFFAYTGFQTITTFISDIKGGSRAAAKAMIMAVVLSIVIYALVVFSMLLLVPAENYVVTADPLAFALKSVHAPEIFIMIIDIGAIIATASAAIAMLLSASRVSYQISIDGLLPKVFRKFDRKRDVAVNGIIFSAFVSAIALFSGNIFTIAAISNFGLLFSYIIACLALVHFRRIGKLGDVRSPLYPYLPIIAVIAMIIFILGMPNDALLIGAILIFSLIAVYYSLREISEKKVIRVRLFK